MQTEKNEKLGILSILGYGSGEFASQMSWVMCTSYLSVFYTDVVGIAPAMVSVLFLVARLWDALNDNIMGVISDRVNTRWGKLRPYILFGSPVLALFVILSFTSPSFLHGSGKLVWAYVTYILCGMAYTVVCVPYGGLSARMTYNQNARNRLNGARFVGLYASQILLNVTTMPIILASGGTTNGRGYTNAAIIFSILSVIFYTFTFFTCKEKINQGDAPTKIAMKTAFKCALQNKYLIILLIFNFAMMGGVMGRVGLVVYYVIYNLGRPDMVAVFMVIPTAVAIIGILIALRIFKKIDQRIACMVSTGGCLVATVVIYLIPSNNIPLLLGVTAFYGLMMFAAPFSATMIANTVDYGEDKFGLRVDGTAFALYSFSLKLGIAVTPAIGLAVMSAAGYIANQPQSAETLNAINAMTNLLPATFFGIAFISMVFYGLRDKESAAIRQRLQAKNVQE